MRREGTGLNVLLVFKRNLFSKKNFDVLVKDNSFVYIVYFYSHRYIYLYPDKLGSGMSFSIKDTEYGWNFIFCDLTWQVSATEQSGCSTAGDEGQLGTGSAGVSVGGDCGALSHHSPVPGTEIPSFPSLSYTLIPSSWTCPAVHLAGG